MELDEFRSALDGWLDEQASQLAPDHPAGTLDDEMAQLAKVKRAAYDAGWMRWGWPERVGGLGGSPILRAYLGEALTTRDLVNAGGYSMTEVLAPTMIDYARPELAAQYAARCVLLTRTGPPESAHRGITAMFVDMASPGITVHPLGTMHGGAEFCEVFFDDVPVPFERTLGEEGQGWAVAMDILPFERSTALWHRGALLNRRFSHFLAAAQPETVGAAEVGDVFLQLLALRARSRGTQHRMAAGEKLGPETSVDKILLATAEQALFDLVAAGLTDDVLLGDDAPSERWRADFLYSRAATIYGGSAEIQRNIVARRLLDLGADA